MPEVCQTNAIILKLQGNIGVAAYGVVANLSLVVTSIYTGIAQIVSLSRGFIVIIPMTFLMSFLFKMTGVWLAYPLTESMVAWIGDKEGTKASLWVWRLYNQKMIEYCIFAVLSILYALFSFC